MPTAHETEPCALRVSLAWAAHCRLHSFACCDSLYATHLSRLCAPSKVMRPCPLNVILAPLAGVTEACKAEPRGSMSVCHERWPAAAAGPKPCGAMLPWQGHYLRVLHNHPASLEAMESAPGAGQPAEGSFGDLPPALLGRVLALTGTAREIG